jgi:ketosteroid isomerase-like protein
LISETFSEPTVSQENVALVLASFEAWERGDVASALAVAHPQVVTHRVDPDDAVFHGREGFLRAQLEWTEGFSEWSQSREECIDAGEHVIVRVHQTARGAGSGVPIEGDYWLVFTLAERKVTRLDIYSKETDALNAAGLRGDGSCGA